MVNTPASHRETHHESEPMQEEVRCTNTTTLGQEIKKQQPKTNHIISELIIRNDDPKLNMKIKDTQIFSSSYDANELVVNLNSDLAHVCNWLKENRLQMHPSKCKIMFIGSPYNLNNIICEEPVVANAKPISRTATQMCLGVKIDENLNCNSHIEMISKKASAAIGAMKRIKPFVLMHTLESIYKSLVQPYFDYCSPLWDTCGKLLRDKLQRFQSRAARVLNGANYDTRSADLLNMLSWDTLENRRSGAKSVLMYKTLNDHTAPGLGGHS